MSCLGQTSNVFPEWIRTKVLGGDRRGFCDGELGCTGRASLFCCEAIRSPCGLVSSRLPGCCAHLVEFLEELTDCGNRPGADSGVDARSWAPRVMGHPRGPITSRWWLAHAQVGPAQGLAQCPGACGADVYRAWCVHHRAREPEPPMANRALFCGMSSRSIPLRHAARKGRSPPSYGSRNRRSAPLEIFKVARYGVW
jgi:hypothetical protein